MGRCGWATVVIGISLACASRAEAKPNHVGFTGDLGAGLAVTFVPSAPGAETKAQFGYAPLSVSLGGFVSPHVAILGRNASTAFFRDKHVLSNSFTGPIVEIWPDDLFYFSAGAGLALKSRSGLFTGAGPDLTAGWGLELRAGFALLQNPIHDFTVSAELLPSFYRQDGISTHATGCALVAAWKWY